MRLKRIRGWIRLGRHDLVLMVSSLKVVDDGIHFYGLLLDIWANDFYLRLCGILMFWNLNIDG